MAGEWQSLLFRLVGDGEVGFAGQVGVYFDEAHPAFLERLDGCTRFGGIANRDAPGIPGRRAVKNWSGGDDVRADYRSRFALVAPTAEHIPVAAHVAHARDAVRNEKPKRRLPELYRSRPRKSQMHVHIPQSGNEE